MATPIDSRGAEGGRPDPTGEVPGKVADQGGRLRCHLPNPGAVPGNSKARRGVGESAVVGAAGNQEGGRRAAGRYNKRRQG